MDTIQEFLQLHIAREGSARRLAERSGLNHQTINDLLVYVPGESSLPSMATVLKLAEGTRTDPLVIFALLLKGIRNTVTINEQDLITAQQFKELSEDHRRFFRELVLAAALSKRHSEA